MDRRLASCVVCVGLVCAVAAGCSKASAPPSDLRPLVSEKSDDAAPRTSARRATAPPVENPRDFGAMFQNEAANRPIGTIRAEDALEAFRQEGIELETVRQHLARPYGARYCVGAKSGTVIALSVCEYIDPAAANAGAESSRKVVLANREVLVNQATSLTVREVDKTPGAEALAQRLFHRFAQLSAPTSTK